MALYHEAARVIAVATDKKGSLKSLVQNSKCENKKALYALVCESLRYDDVISSLLTTSKITQRERQLQAAPPNLVKVMLYDFLFGKGLRAAPKPFKTAILNHKTSLRAELARLKVKAGASSNEDLLPDHAKKQASLPRYVRVNLLKTTTDKVIEHFQSSRYTHVNLEDLSYPMYIDAVQNLKPRQFLCDPHIDGLLTFATGTDLHDDALYKSGHIILQDKASCIPAHVLSPPADAHVIDCCAAPGNKTTHAAALMGNKGKVFSFDMDPHRLRTMNKMVQHAGATCVTTKNQDFLSVDPTDPRYEAVEYVIVDPSCSGSGIVSRLGALTDDKNSVSSERLQNLAKFQLSILCHALSFPAAQRVVYSTCSVHQEENEDVVKLALKNSPGFTLSAASPEMPSRGHDVFPDSNKCLRLSPSQDCTNGFFVACFVRKLSVKSAAVDNDTVVTSSHGEIVPGISQPQENAKKKKHKRKKTLHVDSPRNQSVVCDLPESIASSRQLANAEETQSKSEGTIAANGDMNCSKKKMRLDETSSQRQSHDMHSADINHSSSRAKKGKKKHQKKRGRPVTC